MTLLSAGSPAEASVASTTPLIEGVAVSMKGHAACRASLSRDTVASTHPGGTRDRGRLAIRSPRRKRGRSRAVLWRRRAMDPDQASEPFIPWQFVLEGP